MLNNLDITVSEVILFENLKRTAERITDLEESDEDRWSTIAYLCKKVENLEQNFKTLREENNSLTQTNKNLTRIIYNLSQEYSKIVEDHKEILRLVKRVEN